MVVINNDEAIERYKRVANTARVCYEAHRAYCITIGETVEGSWDQLSHWEQRSIIYSVEFLLVRGHTAKRLHELWLETKRATGWIHGSVKNPLRMEHPCLVEYDELSSEHRKKDDLFRAIIMALIKDLYGKKTPHGRLPSPF